MNERKIGRPKKRPDYDRNAEMAKLIQKAVELFSVPFDDRCDRPKDMPTLTDVADTMKTTRLRVRKLLITAGFYSTATTREIQRLYDSGLSIGQICDKIGMSVQNVDSQLPYRKGIYNLEDPSGMAMSCSLYRKRNAACAEIIRLPNDMDCLWRAIEAFEGYSFTEECGDKPIKYKLNGENVMLGKQQLSRMEIEEAYRSFADRKLQCGELYIIFHRLCDSSEKI